MASLTSTRSLITLALVGLLVVISSAACGSGVEPCVESTCAAGNKCLAHFGEVKCRKTCASNTDPATSCPFGFNCQASASPNTPAFCVQSKATRPDGKPLVQKPAGQWGAFCRANLGLTADCDGEQGFVCHGISPTDATAYCTRYGCTRNDECGPGFWCGKVNTTPNVLTAKREVLGETHNVCLRRTYCAPCVGDVDCPELGGTKQHCVADDFGTPFCAQECVGLGTCPNEAKCIEAGLPAPEGKTAGPKICFPRAQICVGDGSLCSPCRNDSDCGEDGACIKGEKTTEKSCAKRSPAACDACPKSVASPPGRVIGCAKDGTDSLPAKYCVGLYEVGGEPADLGCWSLDR